MDPDKATELRSVVTNTVFRETLAGLEAEAFDKFMALDVHKRWGLEGRALIDHIDALRDVRDRLDWLASTQPAAPRDVV